MNSATAAAETRLPETKAPALPAAPESDQSRRRSRRVAKAILIADRDRDLVNILSVRCRRMGFKVLGAADASTALALIRSCSPDVICLDGDMPAERGLRLCEMLADDDTCDDVPLVILAAQTDPETIIRCHALSAYYVEKCPETWNRLELLLRELLTPPVEPLIAAPALPRPEPAVPPIVPTELTPSQPAQAAGDTRQDAATAPLGDCPQEAAEPVSRPAESATAPEDAAAPTLAAAIEPAVAGMVELPASCAPIKSVSEESPDARAVEQQSTDPENLPGSETVWRHLTQLVGRVVGRTATIEEQNSAAEPGAPAPVEGERMETIIGSAIPTEKLDAAWAAIGEQNAPCPAPLDATVDRSSPEPEKTVLIADDDSDLVQMIALRCKQMGLRVFRSPDAMHALLGVHRVRPDLVVLDVNMPGGNGLSICEMLAGDQELRTTPVIIMTGDTNAEIPRRCEALRVEFLRKGGNLWERLEPMLRSGLRLPAGSVSAADSAGESPRPRILCIDDDPDFSRILKLRLEPFGVDVLRAFNGMQGYWTALDMRPDLVILDMVMPDGAGNYIFGRLRSHPLTKKVPVLMLTGVNTPSTRREMFALGVDAYLTKPVNFESLVEHIRQYVPIADQAPNPELVGASR
jgi:DNA-binding response OmpR family regulator